MHVELRRMHIIQKYAAMVVKFDDDNRALDPVVERVVIAVSADPAEVRL